MGLHMKKWPIDLNICKSLQIFNFLTYVSKHLLIMVKSRICRPTDMWISVIIHIYTLAADFYRSSPILAAGDISPKFESLCVMDDSSNGAFINHVTQVGRPGGVCDFVTVKTPILA